MTSALPSATTRAGTSASSGPPRSCGTTGVSVDCANGSSAVPALATGAAAASSVFGVTRSATPAAGFATAAADGGGGGVLPGSGARLAPAGVAAGEPGTTVAATAVDAALGTTAGDGASSAAGAANPASADF